MSGELSVESVRILCDVMIPAEFSAAIRAQSYDVAEARHVALSVQQNDWLLLEEAARHQRVVVTCSYSDPESNFSKIHQEWLGRSRRHAGIILIPQAQISSRLRRWEVRDRLLRFLNEYQAHDLSNRLWWLPQA